MMSSASNSNPSGHHPIEKEAPSPSPGDSAPRKFLQEVLRETAASIGTSVGELADPEVLREVAQRYRGYPFELEPVLVEMVHAALENQFQKTIGDRFMSRQIAESLFEDPAAHERLKQLWARLTAAQ